MCRRFAHRGPVIASLPPVEHHQWVSPGDSSADHGLTPLDPSTLNLLRQWRRREPVRDPRHRWLALALALLLHGLFVWVTWRAMLPPVAPSASDVPAEVAMQVRFISRPPHKTSVPPPVTLPAAPRPPKLRQPVSRPPRPPVAHHEAPDKKAMTIQLPAGKPPQLYSKDGALRLPAAAASTATPDYVSHALQGDTRIMRHDHPITYQATRFDQYFPPPDETAGGAVVRHVVNAVIKTQAVRLPGGIHLKCKTVLGIPTPDCIDPPSPPSAKDGDERLSMAPARPLATDPHVSKPPGIKACIAMYRAGKPLAYGCPIDTPDRSAAADMREQARKHWSGH